jgi:beta-lactam-binding protein with PASTA domain
MNWRPRRRSGSAGRTVVVPVLVGLPGCKAQDAALDGQLLAVVMDGESAVGVVTRQHPDSGRRVPIGTTIHLWVSEIGPLDPPDSDSDDGRGGFDPRLPWVPGPRVPSRPK